MLVQRRAEEDLKVLRECCITAHSIYEAMCRSIASQNIAIGDGRFDASIPCFFNGWRRISLHKFVCAGIDETIPAA